MPPVLEVVWLALFLLNVAYGVGMDDGLGNVRTQMIKKYDDCEYLYPTQLGGWDSENAQEIAQQKYDKCKGELNAMADSYVRTKATQTDKTVEEWLNKFTTYTFIAGVKYYALYIKEGLGDVTILLLAEDYDVEYPPEKESHVPISFPQLTPVKPSNVAPEPIEDLATPQEKRNDQQHANNRLRAAWKHFISMIKIAFSWLRFRS